METLRSGASILVNSICFQPLAKSRYDFDFKNPQRKIVYVPVSVTTPSPAPPPPPAASTKASTNTGGGTYYVPCMLIQGKNLSTAFNTSSSQRSHQQQHNNKSQQNADQKIAKKVILHFHGTSGDIEKSHLWAILGKDLPEYDILCVEFPGGYGTASSRFPSSSSSSQQEENSSFQPFLCSRESLMTTSQNPIVIPKSKKIGFILNSV